MGALAVPLIALIPDARWIARRALLALALGAVWPLPAPAAPEAPDAALIARGAYVARLGDCAGCHTAPMGGTPYAGGLKVNSPFGTIVSTNITPDPVAGIGAYRYAEFVEAMRRGVRRDGANLYPAMPYTAFAKMDEADLRALYAFLMRGVAPSINHPPPTHLPFPFNQRWALGIWKAAFLRSGPYRTRPDRDAVWNRGAYLVQSLGHCGACHTPRGVAFQERGSDESAPLFLTGMVNDHWFASNLTGDPGSGLGRVSEDALVRFLKTGHGDGLVAYGSMVQTIEDSLQYVSDTDLRAIARYLKSLPARHGSGQFRPDARLTVDSVLAGDRTQLPPAGAPAYRGFCAGCHGSRGEGVPGVFPRLAGNPSVLSDDTTSLIRLLVEGGNSPATGHGPSRQPMPGFAARLSNAQMAQVLTYLRNQWGNRARQITANDVATLREALHK